MRLPKNGPCGGNTKSSKMGRKVVKRGQDSIPHVTFLLFFNRCS